MNNSMIRVLAMCSLIATLGTVNAIAQSSAHYTIPFGFSVGQKSFAAGDYSVREVMPNVLMVQSEDRNANTLILASGNQPWKIADRPTLTFQKYGDQYFLSKVSDCDRGWKLTPSRREKELIAKAKSPKQPEVMAFARK